MSGRGKKRARPAIRILASGSVGELTNQAMIDSRANEAAPADYPELPPEKKAQPVRCTVGDVRAARMEEEISTSIRFSGYHQSKYRAPEVERYSDRKSRVEGRLQVLDEPFKLETMYYPPELVDVRRAANRAAEGDRRQRRRVLAQADLPPPDDDDLVLNGAAGDLLEDAGDGDDDEEDGEGPRRGAAAVPRGQEDELYAEDLNNDDQDDEDDGDYAAHGDMDDDDEGGENDAL